MKNIKSLLVISCLLLLTGCGSNTMTCTQTTTDSDGYVTSETMNINYDNNYVTSIEQIIKMEMDADYIDISYNFTSLVVESFNEINGLELSYEKISDSILQSTLNIDYTKIDIESLNVLFDDMDNEFYKPNVSIDQFTEKHLDGYSCSK